MREKVTSRERKEKKMWKQYTSVAGIRTPFNHLMHCISIFGADTRVEMAAT